MRNKPSVISGSQYDSQGGVTTSVNIQTQSISNKYGMPLDSNRIPNLKDQEDTVLFTRALSQEEIDPNINQQEFIERKDSDLIGSIHTNKNQQNPRSILRSVGPHRAWEQKQEYSEKDNKQFKNFMNLMTAKQKPILTKLTDKRS